MKKKTKYIFLYLFLCLAGHMYGQVKVSEFIQASRLAEPEDGKLIFVDFWATWCKPCIHVSKYVETLQEQFPNDFYAVSLTKESKDVVMRFMPKHPSRLAIALDKDGETFLKHGITALPYGVLYDGRGEIVWKGHPADLTENRLRSFIKRNRHRGGKRFSEIVDVSAEMDQEGTPSVMYRPEQPVEVFISGGKSGQNLMYEKGEYTYFGGKTDELVALLKKVSAIQVEVREDKNNFTEVYALTGIWKNDPEQILKYVYDKSGISEHVLNKEGEVYRLEVNDPSGLWNADQLDWGRDSPRFLVDDMQIQADNVTFGDFLTELGSALGIPVVSSYEDHVPRDWKLQYRFFDLMKDQLKDTYGIDVIKDIAVYKVIILR
ncbi:TlpA family protein disulfide reductase [Sinomicrobium sp. M5D2P17]